MAASSSDQARNCPNCQQPVPMPITPIVLISVGGLLLFFGGFFALIGGITESGLTTVGMLIVAIASIMMVAGFLIYRQHKKRLREEYRLALERAHCKYCDAQNEIGAQRCFSCSAPLTK